MRLPLPIMRSSVFPARTCIPKNVGYQVDTYSHPPQPPPKPPTPLNPDHFASACFGAGCALLGDGITAILKDLLLGGDAVGSGHSGLYPPYMAVINRLALIHPQHFGAMVTGVSTTLGADVMSTLLDLWIDKFDAVSEPGWRKLSVLAGTAKHASMHHREKAGTATSTR